jgi:nucleotide-binding universal stress UspA family protein
MLNHVLIPLDGSSLAETAISAAKQILAVNATITLVTAVDMPPTPVYGIDLPMTFVPASANSIEETIKHARNYLSRIASDLRDEGYHVHIVVSIGEAAIVIGETAERNHVDAIVICTHGRSGIGRWLYGSVTNKVLSTARCPIYVVPNMQKEKASQKALTATTSLTT